MQIRQWWNRRPRFGSTARLGALALVLVLGVGTAPASASEDDIYASPYGPGDDWSVESLFAEVLDEPAPAAETPDEPVDPALLSLEPVGAGEEELAVIDVPFVYADGYNLPTYVAIPTIGAYANVTPLGLEEDGAMAAPADPDEVGWYQYGPGIGSPGNAILAGHVDWGGYLRAFGLLHYLAPGDAVYVTDHLGQEYLYTVAWSEWVDQYASPEAYFAQSEVEEITLITCGGVFDQASGQYLSRLIVRAVREPVAVAEETPAEEVSETTVPEEVVDPWASAGF